MQHGHAAMEFRGKHSKLKETKPELWNEAVRPADMWLEEKLFFFFKIASLQKIKKIKNQIIKSKHYLLRVVWEDFQQYGWVKSLKASQHITEQDWRFCLHGATNL